MTGRVREMVRHTGTIGLILILGVLALGGVGSAAAAKGLLDGKRGQAELLVDRRAALSREAAVGEVHRYVDTLRTVAASLGGYDPLTAAKFAASTSALADAGFRGITSVVFLVSAADRQVAAVQQTWRGLGVPDLILKPWGGGGEHLFTVFTRALDGRPVATPGTDVAQLAEPTAALQESRRSGRASVSDAYVLLVDRKLPAAQRQLSFVLTAPVYSVPDASGQRAFVGWVLMGLHGQDFMGGVLKDATQGQVDAMLRATDSTGAMVNVAALDVVPHADLVRTVTIPLADRQWTLRVSASSDALASTRSAVALFTAGLLGTLLLAGFLWVLATDRARAQAQVVAATAETRRQLELLNGILEQISDGVGVTDEQGEFLVHNPAAKTMLGVVEDRSGAETWQEHYGLFLPDGTTPFPMEQLPLVRALAGESTDKVEMVVRNATRPDGTLLSVSGRPLEVNGQRGAIAVFHDITEERAREADLGAFAGIVAHDLKNPLAVIASHAELATACLDDGEVGVGHARESMVRVTGGVIRMRRLIDDLLAYTTARDAQLRIQPVDLHALVADVVSERVDHLAARPDVYIGPLPYVDADPGLLRHVLDNLVGNAVKYVPHGRTAKIDISATPERPGWTRIAVADRGIGIPDAEKPRVFESFHRAHYGSGYGGTGLGLAICRRVVDRHGGSISVEDNPGGGSRFAFTIPLATAPGAVHAPPLSDHEYV